MKRELEDDLSFYALHDEQAP